MPKLYQTLAWVVLGCTVAAVGLGVGLSAVINASLSQGGSSLEGLFESDPGAQPSAAPDSAPGLPANP
jgi:hypothetical protein